MNNELVQLAEKKGFHTDIVNEDPNKYSELIQFLWMCSLQKWLREVHNIHIVVYIFKPEDKNKYCCDIVSDIFKENLEDDQSFDTYEEALEQALYQVLQLIK